MGCAVWEAMLDLEIPSRNKNVNKYVWQAYRKKERQKDKQINIKTDRQMTDKQTDRRIDSYADWQTDMQVDREIDRQRYKQIDRHRNIQTERPTDRHTNIQTDIQAWLNGPPCELNDEYIIWALQRLLMPVPYTCTELVYPFNDFHWLQGITSRHPMGCAVCKAVLDVQISSRGWN